MSASTNHARNLCTGETALVPGSLRGFRSWDLQIYSNPVLGTGDAFKDTPDTVGLFSMSVAIPWTQPMAAGCYRTKSGCPCATCTTTRMDKLPPHDPSEVVPVTDCECGVYGWYHPDWIEKDRWWPKAGAVGVIEATGKVVMGSRGFRCQQASILAVAPACKPDILVHSVGVDGFLASWEKVEKRLLDNGVLVFSDVDTLFNFYPPEDLSALVEVEPPEGSDDVTV